MLKIIFTYRSKRALSCLCVGSSRIRLGFSLALSCSTAEKGRQMEEHTFP